VINTYKRHRFPPDIIAYAVWLYYRFNLSHRDIEGLQVERGITGSYTASTNSSHRKRSFRAVIDNKQLQDYEGSNFFFFMSMTFSPLAASLISGDNICGEIFHR
jgi:hypothetical protein